MNTVNPVPVFLGLQEPVSHLVDPTGSNVLVPYPGLKWRHPGQNFRHLVSHHIVIPHIVKITGSVKAVEIIVVVMLRHFVPSAASRVVEDGFPSNFTR